MHIVAGLVLVLVLVLVQVVGLVVPVLVLVQVLVLGQLLVLGQVLVLVLVLQLVLVLVLGLVPASLVSFRRPPFNQYFVSGRHTWSLMIVFCTASACTLSWGLGGIWHEAMVLVGLVLAAPIAICFVLHALHCGRECKQAREVTFNYSTWT